MNVLLVCMGNVDRSPLAEFLLNKMLAAEGIVGVKVQSRGISAVADRPMSDGSQALLLFEEDIIANGHRSRPLTDTDVRRADLILTVERHFSKVLDRFPEAVGKVSLLSEFAGSGNSSILKTPPASLAMRTTG